MIPYGEVIYTGPVDEYFDYRFGKLPYRSLEFQFETLERRWRSRRRSSTTRTSNAVHARHRVQVPDRAGASEDDARLRVSAGRGRSVLPGAAAGERRALSASTRRSPTRRRACTSSAGSATYKYYNMDQVVAQALTLYAKLAGVRARRHAVARMTA